MTAMIDELNVACTIVRIGRQRTAHMPRVLIEDNAVVVRTRCGTLLTPCLEGFTETYGIPSCLECIEDADKAVTA